MLRNPSSDFDESSIDTILAKDIDCKGKLVFNKDVLIKGRFEGEIETPSGQLYVGGDAEINSPAIKASIISNKGKITGNLEAKERVEQYRGATLEGDIVTKDIYFETGSTFNGNCTMISKDDKHL